MAVNMRDVLVAVWAQYTAVHPEQAHEGTDLLWVEAARKALDSASVQLWRWAMQRANGAAMNEEARGMLVEALVRAGAYTLDGLLAYADRPEALYRGLCAAPDVDQIAADLGRLVAPPSAPSERGDG
jgi:hypothetical protein